MKSLTGSSFIDDWNGVNVTVYVDSNVRFGRDTVEGLRISTEPPRVAKQELTPKMKTAWQNAIAAYKRDGNLDAVKKRMTISSANEGKIIKEANKEANTDVA